MLKHSEATAYGSVQGASCDSNKLIRGCLQDAGIYVAIVLESQRRTATGNLRRRCLELGWVKMNVDGVVSERTGQARNGGCSGTVMGAGMSGSPRRLESCRCFTQLWAGVRLIKGALG